MRAHVHLFIRVREKQRPGPSALSQGMVRRTLHVPVVNIKYGQKVPRSVSLFPKSIASCAFCLATRPTFRRFRHLLSNASIFRMVNTVLGSATISVSTVPYGNASISHRAARVPSTSLHVVNYRLQTTRFVGRVCMEHVVIKEDRVSGPLTVPISGVARARYHITNF